MSRDEELARACKAAGGAYVPQFNEWHFRKGQPDARKIPAEWRDVLQAYVASLLVAKAERKPGTYCCALERATEGTPFGGPFATPAQLITAALEVLDER